MHTTTWIPIILHKFKDCLYDVLQFIETGSYIKEYIFSKYFRKIIFIKIKYSSSTYIPQFVMKQ